MIKLKDLIPEGFMGWEHYEESDTASDHYHTLKDLYKKNKNESGRLVGDFKRWLDKLDRDKGNEYNLTGYQALALISKEPLFSDVAQATQPHVDVRRYARKAFVELKKDLQHAKQLGREGDEQAKGLQGMMKAIKTWA